MRRFFVVYFQTATNMFRIDTKGQKLKLIKNKYQKIYQNTEKIYLNRKHMLVVGVQWVISNARGNCTEHAGNLYRPYTLLHEMHVSVIFPKCKILL
jgi:hypothetical protein